ncbi:MAG: FkbM family methyltransferase [Aestuariivita sp.]|uniref:FkbM family methyltransferase n=1 Tax=Aestuariivita sp. TaxID=1872407 RepID=UPI0023717FC2|nr:FkbM family methyltransferase [bacterium]
MAHILSKTKMVNRARLRELKEREQSWFDLRFVKALPAEQRSTVIDLLEKSKSQIRQDLFALAMNDFKRNGFFVEFGATDGVELNNSWLLEKEFGWSGIAAEPARGWHSELRKNRNCMIDTRCVWSETGDQIEFTEARRGVNSGISSFVPTGRKIRGTSYKVETVSLNDLLSDHGAPEVIDYISIDTEGSEYDILQAVDFDRWTFRVMTIEHNHAPQRNDMFKLLSAQGYRRVHEEISNFDDWYVKA